MMSARERLLSAENGFLVAMSRVADRATLVVDSVLDLERLFFVKAAPRARQSRPPGPESRLSKAVRSMTAKAIGICWVSRSTS